MASFAHYRVSFWKIPKWLHLVKQIEICKLALFFLESKSERFSHCKKDFCSIISVWPNDNLAFYAQFPLDTHCRKSAIAALVADRLSEHRACMRAILCDSLFLSDIATTMTPGYAIEGVTTFINKRIRHVSIQLVIG